MIAFSISLIFFSCGNKKRSQRIYINEFSASNFRVIINPHTQKCDDWIELYNGSKKAINLEGWFLSDIQDNPNKWVFPDSTIIDPDSYLLIWTNNKDTLLNTNFKLSKTSESIFLFSNDN